MYNESVLRCVESLISKYTKGTSQKGYKGPVICFNKKGFVYPVNLNTKIFEIDL